MYPNNQHILTLDDLTNASRIYEIKERKAGAYWEALDLVNTGWPNMEKVSNGIVHLLKRWLRFQSNIDPAILFDCLNRNQSNLEEFRPRTLYAVDEHTIDDRISRLFQEIQIAQRSTGGESGVGVAKTLALLAPAYFPLWDTKIAHHYGCSTSALGYINFMKMTRKLAKGIAAQHSESKGIPVSEAILDIEEKCSNRNRRKTLLKIIDEYNYSRYTFSWIN